jgi:hypothetical protein
MRMRPALPCGGYRPRRLADLPRQPGAHRHAPRYRERLDLGDHVFLEPDGEPLAQFGRRRRRSRPGKVARRSGSPVQALDPNAACGLASRMLLHHDALTRPLPNNAVPPVFATRPKSPALPGESRPISNISRFAAEPRFSIGRLWTTRRAWATAAVPTTISRPSRAGDCCCPERVAVRPVLSGVGPEHRRGRVLGHSRLAMWVVSASGWAVLPAVEEMLRVVDGEVVLGGVGIQLRH